MVLRLRHFTCHPTHHNTPRICIPHTHHLPFPSGFYVYDSQYGRVDVAGGGGGGGGGGDDDGMSLEEYDRQEALRRKAKMKEATERAMRPRTSATPSATPGTAAATTAADTATRPAALGGTPPTAGGLRGQAKAIEQLEKSGLGAGGIQGLGAGSSSGNGVGPGGGSMPIMPEVPRTPVDTTPPPPPEPPAWMKKKISKKAEAGGDSDGRGEGGGALAQDQQINVLLSLLEDKRVKEAEFRARGKFTFFKRPSAAQQSVLDGFKQDKGNIKKLIAERRANVAAGK